MLIETLGLDFTKIRATNTTDASFPSRLIRATEPSGIGDSVAQATASAVFDCRGGFGNVVQNAVKIEPFGAGSNNNTFSLRVIGWKRVVDRASPGDVNLWVWRPTVLVELACTISSTDIGLVGKCVAATDLFADTITLTTGNDDVSVDIVSPTGDLGAHAIVDLKGSQLYEITFGTGSSATSCNALVSRM